MDLCWPSSECRETLSPSTLEKGMFFARFWLLSAMFVAFVQFLDRRRDNQGAKYRFVSCRETVCRNQLVPAN